MPRASKTSAAGGLGFLLLAVAGCGGSGSPHADQHGHAPSPLGHHLIEASEQATSLAEQTENEAAALDHRTRARLLTRASAAEARRAGLAVEAQQLAQELLLVERDVLALRTARDDVRRAAAQEQAAGVALAQASRAFERAVRDEQRRRGSEREKDRLHREAATILRRRARFLLASAAALGADEDARSEARSAIRRSEQANTGGAAIAAASEAVDLAYRAHAASRLSDAPPAERIRVLKEACQGANIAFEQRDEGLVLVLDQIFGRRNSLTDRGEQQVRRITSVLHGVDLGPIQVWVEADGQDGDARRQATSRAAMVQNAFERGDVQTRSAEAVEAGTLGHHVMILLPAIGPQQPTHPTGQRSP